jgi:pre-mRNA-splicing factor 18
MDFASLMSAQISKSKSTSPPSDAQSPSASTSKYLKRSELEAQRQAAYVAEQARLDKEREERLAKKRKLEEEEADRDRAREEKKRRLAEESRRRREEEEARQERMRRKRLGLPELPGRDGSKEGTPLEDGEEDIVEEELLTKLRALGEPAVLFGESHAARLRRYKKLTRRALTPKLSDGPIPTTLELVDEAEMKVPNSVPAKGTKERDFLFRQLASYFTMVLREWEQALGRREASVKESFQGKAAYNAMVQSRENMRPLFKKFEKGDLEDGVLTPVVEIVRCAQERRYVDANDGYLRLSIGKA